MALRGQQPALPTPRYGIASPVFHASGYSAGGFGFVASDLTIVRAAVYLARSAGKSPGRRIVDALVRTVNDGKSFKRERLDLMIAQVVLESGQARTEEGRPGPQTAPEYTRETDSSGHNGRGRGTKGLAIETKTKTQTSLLSPNGESPAPPRKKRREPKPPAEWVAPLEAAVAEFLVAPNRDDGLELADLDVEQRLVLGRIHALRFGACRSDEATNRRRGAQVAAALATMALSVLRDLSVREYLQVAARTYEMHGRPYFDPWFIKAAIPPARMAVAR
jgi:hypothetical protein